MEIPLKLERIIFCLTQENIDSSVNQTVKLFDTNFPYSFNIIIINLVYYAFYSQKNSCDVTLNYLELIQAKEVNINKKIPKIIDVFIKHISGIREQEAYYLLENIIKRNWANINIVKNIKTKYFAHYKTDKENKINANLIAETNFIENYEELSKNDFELHKQLIEEGHNPSEIAKIIRNDEIEKLQEISSQTNFDFNQKIEPSLYERCSFVNKENVSLIDFAAFFSSVKCFKYLLMNGANVENTGKYAVACGNEEILHLCEQNHSSFEDAYETAIKFHQNNILKYLYENKLIIDKLINFCIYYGNYETLSYLEKDFAKNDKIDIGKAAKTGNLYLVAYFLQHNQIPKDILIFSSSSDNIELLKIILEYEGIDINEQNIFLFY